MDKSVHFLKLNSDHKVNIVGNPEIDLNWMRCCEDTECLKMVQ